MSFLKHILGARLYIGNIMNIPIYIHWSLLLMSLIVWNSYGYQIAIQYFSIFLAVLLHELGHCYVAKKYNFNISSINLLPIGGMAIIDIEISNPIHEFMVTIGGLLVSLALACLTFPIWFLMRQSILDDFLWFFLCVNITIFLFNLIPAFPMDGGRLLRSCLNGFWNDPLRSTLTTVNVSLFVFGLMLLVGFYFSSPGLILTTSFMSIMLMMELKIMFHKTPNNIL